MPGLSPATPLLGHAQQRQQVVRETDFGTTELAKLRIVHVTNLVNVKVVMVNALVTNDVLYQLRHTPGVTKTHLWNLFVILCSVLPFQLGATIGFALLAWHTGKWFKQLLQTQRGRCVLMSFAPLLREAHSEFNCRVDGPSVRCAILMFTVVWSVLLVLCGIASYILYTKTREAVACAKTGENCDKYIHMCFAVAVLFPVVTFCSYCSLLVYYDQERRCGVAQNPRP